jgi:hypothetical protein
VALAVAWDIALPAPLPIASGDRNSAIATNKEDIKRSMLGGR